MVLFYHCRIPTQRAVEVVLPMRDPEVRRSVCFTSKMTIDPTTLEDVWLSYIAVTSLW